MAFRVGQKVVCVDDAPRGYKSALVRKGGIYTIVGLPMAPDGEPGVLLAEVDADAPYGFWQYRFRPLTERKTDISFAHEILRKATKRVNA